jgi:murein DD-endopeptidase MepM/ murein hydrolase activator NlpD
MALAAVFTTLGGQVGGVGSSLTGSDPHPVAETSAGYLRPPALISTVPSVLARQQEEVENTAVAAAPGTPAPTAAPAAAEAEAPPPAFFTYTVQPGDTLAGIAAAFGISPEYISWNNPGVASNPDMLLVGATVLIPGVDGLVYNVTLGDTLGGIAAYYGIDVTSILAFAPNGLASADMLIEGMTLVLPGAVPPAPVIVEEPDPTPPPVVAEPDPPAPPPPVYEPPPPASSGYIWPFSGNISTYFGGGHRGIDIDGFGAFGAPIGAAASGTVVLAAWDSWGYGYHVIIQHADGSRTLYGHLSDIWVSQGQAVGQGEAIGALGSTGYSTGPHLHFEVHIGGAVDPLAYLP